MAEDQKRSEAEEPLSKKDRKTLEESLIMKRILEEYAPKFYKKNEDGTYQYNPYYWTKERAWKEEDGTFEYKDKEREELQSIPDVLKKNKERMPSPFKDVIMPNEGEQDNNIQELMGYLKDKKLENVNARYLGKGTSAVVLDLGNGDVLRMVAKNKDKGGKQEMLRGKQDVVLQPRHSSARDGENFTNFWNIEVVPRVVTLRDLFDAAIYDYEQRGEEFPLKFKMNKSEKKEDISVFMRLANIPQDHIDRDGYAASNWGVDPIGNLVAFDPATITSEKDYVEQHSKKRLKDVKKVFNEEVCGLPDNPNIFEKIRNKCRDNKELSQSKFFGTNDPKIEDALSRIQEAMRRKLAKEQKVSGKAGTASPNKTAETKKDTSNQPPTDGLPPPSGNGGR